MIAYSTWHSRCPTEKQGPPCRVDRAAADPVPSEFLGGSVNFGGKSIDEITNAAAANTKKQKILNLSTHHKQ